MGRLNQRAERPHTQSDPQSRGPIVCLGRKQTGIMEQFLLYVFFCFLNFFMEPENVCEQFIEAWESRGCVSGLVFPRFPRVAPQFQAHHR